MSLTRKRGCGHTCLMLALLGPLARASHPEPAVAVTAVATLLAVGVGRGPAGVAVTAATVLASQLAIGWVNDAIDAPRDAAVGRRDKPVATGVLSRRTVAVCGVVAAVATAPLGFLSGVSAGVAATLALVSALLYDWPLKSTPLSVLPYAVSFACLPTFVVLGAGATPPTWLILAGALLGAGAHFVNALPDLDDDERTGVRGLPHLLGRNGSLVAAGALLLSATALLAFGPAKGPGWPGWAALAVAVAILPVSWALVRRDPKSKAPFRAVMVIAVLDVILLLVGGLSV
jgi:protoheme IX farnesyltransferase